MGWGWDWECLFWNGDGMECLFLCVWGQDSVVVFSLNGVVIRLRVFVSGHGGDRIGNVCFEVEWGWGWEYLLL